MLKEASDDNCETADAFDDWSKQARFRVSLAKPGDSETREEGWWFEDDFVVRHNDEGEPLEKLIVEHYRDAAQNEDARSIRRPQALADHQRRVEAVGMRIAADLGLQGDHARVLAIAASLHDEGKKAPRWQRAFNAARDVKKFNLTGPLAKTKGPINQALLDGYRHEFGSLPYVGQDTEFQQLPSDLQDLVLHIIAAHHGRARPLIETTGCDDAPPSGLEARARDVALRFAKLQKTWGPWGLAWWESLLRAADQQASRENDERKGIAGAAGEEAA